MFVLTDAALAEVTYAVYREYDEENYSHIRECVRSEFEKAQFENDVDANEVLTLSHSLSTQHTPVLLSEEIHAYAKQKVQQFLNTHPDGF